MRSMYQRALGNNPAVKIIAMMLIVAGIFVYLATCTQVFA